MSEVFVPSKDKLYPEIYIDNFRDFLNSILQKPHFVLKILKQKKLQK